MIMKKMLFYQPAIFLIVMFTFLSSAQADGFWDQGFRTGTLRTDFDDQTTGLQSNPLVQSDTCLFPAVTFAISCNPFDTDGLIKSHYREPYNFHWPTSRPWPSSTDGFWALSVNNENVPENFNLGPPNQSLPVMYSDIVSPPQVNDIAKGTMNIAMQLIPASALTGAEKKRIHMMINNKYVPGNEKYSQKEDSTPFLGIGAFQKRGNKGQVLGALNAGNSRSHTLNFTTTMWGAKGGVIHPVKVVQNNILSYALFVFSEWGGVPRAVAIQLFHQNQDWSCPSGTSSNRDVRDCLETLDSRPSAKWNWTIEQSYFSPGAEIVNMDAEDLQDLCDFQRTNVSGTALKWRLGPREKSTYHIDLQELFECASSLGMFSENMPTNQVLPITGVLWALEATGKNGVLWTSLENMHMN
jgi:hypothetical protein